MAKDTRGTFSGKHGEPGIRPNASIYVSASLVIISILLLMLSSRNFIINFKDIGLSLFTGIRGGVYEVSSFVSRTVLSVKELSDLRKEHAELLRQLSRYEELERSNAEINLENARLREQLGFSRTLRFKRIPAQISGKDPDNLFSAIVINKGSFSGVKNNMPVVAWQNGTQALVGKVIHTGVLESLVMPVFDVNSLIASRFLVSRYEGIVEGRGNQEAPLLLRFVPKRARD
jgi:rod shape-determining protein MreC